MAEGLESPCCHAPVRVAGGLPDFIGDRPGECHTYWYECSACGKDCDPIKREPADA